MVSVIIIVVVIILSIVVICESNCNYTWWNTSEKRWGKVSSVRGRPFDFEGGGRFEENNFLQNLYT